MKLKIREFCVRCGLCEDLHPRLFHLNTESDRVEILHDVIPPELEEDARQAIADCAVTAIFVEGTQEVQDIPRIDSDMTVDAAVMGSGFAGLSAAVTLARRGYKVAVFEKRPFQGGSVSNTPIGTKAVPADPAFRAAAFKSVFSYGNFSGDPGVIRAWVNGTAAIPEFFDYIGAGLKLMGRIKLENVGTENQNSVGFPAGFNNIGDKYMLIGRGRGHGGAIVCLNATRKLRELGGQVYLDSPAVGLLQEGGAVTGLVARNNQTGAEYKVHAKAVLLASGGFPEDREMVKRYTGHTFTDVNCSDGGNVLFNYFPGSRLTGDGHKLAWAAGGAKGAMGINGHNLVPGPGIIGNTPWITFNETRTIQEQPYLWVNQNGERFIDEGQSGNHMAMGTSIARQPGKCGYIIFDEDTRLHMENEGVEFLYFIFPVQKLTDIPGQFEKLIHEKHNEHAFMADTIEELCAQAGIDEAGLKAQLERYNASCEAGEDDEFSKDPAYLRPVRRGRFYALRVFNGGYSTVGGIKINGRCQVVGEDGKAIPGLYAAGDCAAGEIFGDPPTGGIGDCSMALGLGFASADHMQDYMER